jgi:hypothetical protein
MAIIKPATAGVMVNITTANYHPADLLLDPNLINNAALDTNMLFTTQGFPRVSLTPNQTA